MFHRYGDVTWQAGPRAVAAARSVAGSGGSGSMFGDEMFEEEENPCTVCLGELETGATSKLDCGHIYHTEVRSSVLTSRHFFSFRHCFGQTLLIACLPISVLTAIFLVFCWFSFLQFLPIGFLCLFQKRTPRAGSAEYYALDSFDFGAIYIIFACLHARYVIVFLCF